MLDVEAELNVGLMLAPTDSHREQESTDGRHGSTASSSILPYRSCCEQTDEPPAASRSSWSAHPQVKPMRPGCAAGSIRNDLDDSALGGYPDHHEHSAHTVVRPSKYVVGLDIKIVGEPLGVELAKPSCGLDLCFHRGCVDAE